ncbi:hypothetical protein [Mesoterricola silvestris]|uniref:PilZ domain-containing protein n=1 Tax=Mesoterricola silvestris TaxID=2927979 RepID=A0AA48GZE2_9BACT|nr:hypothetical protein [Mesoterricola silvestris]BDU74656.1 hypothetical protein METEAL_38300 [Mesoterricola silvestris]
MVGKKNDRVSVKNRCKASVRAGGGAPSTISLLDLGTQGCRVEMPAHLLERVSGDSVLDGWSLIHPLLPMDVIQAQVLEAHPADRAGFVEAEVRFLGTSEGYRREVQTCMNNLARPWWPSSTLTGMPFPDLC